LRSRRTRPCRLGSISDPHDRSYDLIVCIEVLEHPPSAYADEMYMTAANERLALINELDAQLKSIPSLR